MPKTSSLPKLLKALDKLYPKAGSPLEFSSPLEMLLGAILAAQATDASVNALRPELFRKYPNAAAFAKANLAELQQDLRSIHFYRAKAANILKTCKILVENYGGKVPDTIEELTELPGVGRKTANMVLGNCFGVPGIIVDTHVKRVSYRLGLTQHQENIEKIEQDLMKLVPKPRWTLFSHQVTAHGRQICKAPRPFCSKCALIDLCPRQGVTASK